MTKLEQVRIETMMRMGCAACAWIDIVHTAQECHHILYGNRRMGDWFTLPLCRGHHQGDWSAEQKILLKPEQRVAISNGRKAFTAIYPTEQVLWEFTQGRLGLCWPGTKIVPRLVV